MKRKSLLILGIIELFVAIGALPAGLMFILKPDGSLMGMNTAQLANSPFADFLIPGIALFTVNGIFNLINSILCFTRFRFAAQLGFVLSFGLIIWISVQIYSIGYNHFLQAAYFVIGLLMLIFSLRAMKKEKGNKYS